MGELEEGAGPKLVRTTVELDDHIIVPNLDPSAMSIEPDRTLEDYLSSMSTLPMDHSRPLWEFHVLDFPTSEAVAALAFHAHHSLGDGTSLLSLLVASADSSKTLASMMKSGKDNGVKWGNQLGYMLLPFHIEKHDGPLKYVEKAMRVAHRKKSSMESVFTNWSALMITKIFGIKATASLCYALFKNTTILFSNMVGPTEQVALYGHPILYIAPSIYGQPHALTIHYQSYMNIVKLVLAIDEAQFPDAYGLLEDFVESLRLIREAASGKPRVVEERSQEEHKNTITQLTQSQVTHTLDPHTHTMNHDTKSTREDTR